MSYDDDDDDEEGGIEIQETSTPKMNQFLHDVSDWLLVSWNMINLLTLSVKVMCFPIVWNVDCNHCLPTGVCNPLSILRNRPRNGTHSLGLWRLHVSLPCRYCNVFYHKVCSRRGRDDMVFSLFGEDYIFFLLVFHIMLINAILFSRQVSFLSLISS